MCLSTKACTNAKSGVNATPVSHPDTQTDAKLQEERRHREEDQTRNPQPSSFQEVPREKGHIPFAKAEAVWRAVVAWGGGAVHLVGHVGPRRALRGESTGQR